MSEHTATIKWAQREGEIFTRVGPRWARASAAIDAQSGLERDAAAQHMKQKDADRRLTPDGPHPA